MCFMLDISELQICQFQIEYKSITHSLLYSRLSVLCVSGTNSLFTNSLTVREHVGIIARFNRLARVLGHSCRDIVDSGYQQDERAIGGSIYTLATE
jgi:hypothetical protein